MATKQYSPRSAAVAALKKVTEETVVADEVLPSNNEGIPERSGFYLWG